MISIDELYINQVYKVNRMDVGKVCEIEEQNKRWKRYKFNWNKEIYLFYFCQ